MATSTRRAPRPWHVAIIAGMASYIDAAAIVSSGTAFVLFQQSIGLQPDQIGVLSAALTFSIAIGALVGGRLGDRFGRRSVFLVTMVMIAAGGTALTFGGAFLPLLLGTVLVGLGAGADLPVSLATVSEAAEDHNRGKLVGFTQVMWYAGIIATTAISVGAGSLGYLGGQILFAHIGVAAIVVLLLRLMIPESASWRSAQAERRSGADTVRAQRAGLRDIFSQRIYLVPFLALVGFYSLTNLGANTGGQFGAYVAVNLAGVDVPTFSIIGLISLPVAVVFAVWFMRISDGRFRMAYFVAGGILMSIAYLIPAVFGFSLITILVQTTLTIIGAAFAFEGIMKVWAQEAFPTLLRASAQGAIIAVARVAAAILALFTPALLTTPHLLYGLIGAVVAVGCFIGWLGFRGKQANTFEFETKDIASARRELHEAGVLRDARRSGATRGAPLGKRP
ncbi:MFS transporter [Microbacterium sp. NPDC079995]|uniref:MFS transporter n=1 Tax=unclassified Microbacterium TaxID=2609290 RepID=UPI00344F0E01